MNRVITLNPQTVSFALLVLAIGWWVSVDSHSFQSHAYDVTEVDLQQAQSLIRDGAVVIDVRDKDKFDYRHIPGAMLIPLSVLRAGIPLSLVAVKT